MPVSPGPEASMRPAEIVKPALRICIMLTVFGFGLRATVEDALYLVRHPRMLVIWLVANVVLRCPAPRRHSQGRPGAIPRAGRTCWPCHGDGGGS